MFGALNRFISRLDADVPSQGSKQQNAFGFQVLRNENQDIPIEPWFDFIVGINGRLIDDSDPNLFATEVRNCASSSVSLTLWSAKGQRTFDLRLPVPASSPSLGLTLQWNNILITEDVWHILDIIPSSPADTAGLLPYGDYIIGTPEGIVRGEAGLSELLEDYLDRPLRLYVYNHEYDITRLVTITPSRSWGGSGALGCVLGYGALHRIPAALTEPPQGPGETLFEHTRFEESQSENQPPPTSDSPDDLFTPAAAPSFSPQDTQSGFPNFLVPATIASPPPQGPPRISSASPMAPGHGRKPHGRKMRHAISPNRAFDEYFAESEKKSREEDYVPSSGRMSVPPPPPKVGSGVPPPPMATSPTQPPEAEDINKEES
ncbi:MAG: hypothetical protein M1834_006080 [Cirrosporium novae-zelandiae]|nr:MAG: hypothetical protein M1834_006080 [Cirrosporium novae-zelandiae]